MCSKVKNIFHPVSGDELRKMLLFAVVCAVNLIFVFYHECWRDEAQAWLIARDNSLGSLFSVTSYEGHPCLWFLILMPFARAGLPYVSMRLISFAFIAAAIWLIIYKLHFSMAMKAILSLSPMGLAFFVTPARSYCLCALLTVLLIFAYRKRSSAPIMYGALLAILLQVHIIMAGLVVSCCLTWGGTAS